MVPIVDYHATSSIPPRLENLSSLPNVLPYKVRSVLVILCYFRHQLKCATQMTCLRAKFGEMERRISAKPTPDAVKSTSAPVPSQAGQAATSQSGQTSASAPITQLVIRYEVPQFLGFFKVDEI